MRVIGITGGIGSGKSTVSNYLREKGIYIIDADKISRDLTKKDGEALPFIREAFGDSVFNFDGTLNRKKLSDIVFKDKEKLSILQSFTTDVVNMKMKNEVEVLKMEGEKDIVVLDIPLLFETGDQEFCDETWLVTCDNEKRIERVAKRDSIEAESIRNRILNQMPDDKKKKLATYIIDNNSNLENLYKQIDILLQK